jgi:Ni/Co efflux regulator RcnB
MKILVACLVAALMFGLPSAASAQDGKKKGERPGRKREALLKKFDKDGDGKLNKEERRAAKESMRKDGKGKGKGEGNGKGRKRAFRRADRNGDHKLDKSEREDFRKFREQHRGKRRR